MPRNLTLPSIVKPFAHVHATLTALGFVELAYRQGAVYELPFRDPMTSKEYTFRVYTRTQEHNNGRTEVDLNEAGFSGKEPVPDVVAQAAQQTLRELKDYLENAPVKTKSTPIEHANNGRMANNIAEVKQLGKSMANYPTNAQVRESGMIPDPIQ